MELVGLLDAVLIVSHSSYVLVVFRACGSFMVSEVEISLGLRRKMEVKETSSYFLQCKQDWVSKIVWLPNICLLDCEINTMY